MARPATVLTDEITIGPRHRKDLGDLKALAQSIDAVGLLQPIGLTPDKELVFGKRRLLAVRDVLGWDRIAAVTVTVSSIAAGEYAENEIRKDFTLSERDAIRRSLKKLIGDRRIAPTKEADVQNSAQPLEKGQKTRDVTAEQAGFHDHEEARCVQQVTDKGTPALVDVMDQGVLPVSVAAKVAELPKAKQDKIAKAESPKAAAKEALAPPKPARAFPVSDQFINWLGSLSGFHTKLRQDHKTVATLLRRKEWEKSRTEHAAKLLDAVVRSLTVLNKEMQKYVNSDDT